MEEERRAPAAHGRGHHALRGPPGRRGLAPGALPVLPDRDGCVVDVYVWDGCVVLSSKVIYHPMLYRTTTPIHLKP